MNASGDDFFLESPDIRQTPVVFYRIFLKLIKQNADGLKTVWPSKSPSNIRWQSAWPKHFKLMRV
jgi:hypothetical protein